MEDFASHDRFAVQLLPKHYCVDFCAIRVRVETESFSMISCLSVSYQL